MKIHTFSSFATTLLVGILAAQGQSSPTVSVTQSNRTLTAQGQMLASATNLPPKTDFSKIFKSDQEKLGYTIGMSTATGLKRNLIGADIDYDPDALIQGFKDYITSRPTRITEDEEKEILNDLRKQLSAKMDEKRKQAAEQTRLKGEKNKIDGAAFLAKNKTQPGIVTLPDGLQYKVLADGSGPAPGANDEVTVNYRGTLIDGTEFDSSTKHGKAYTARTSNGIKGWSEALQLMKAGSKWQVFVPAELAYGPNPAGPLIAPNSPLIFEIELLSIKPGQPAPAQSQAARASVGTPLTSDIIKVPSADQMKQGQKIEVIKAEDIDKQKTNSNQ
jgi:FKBP-type peptidyl-prolyl cis-trans isomerase FklB